MKRSWIVRLVPEFGDQRPQQQVLCQAHARVRGHFEGAHFQQAQSTGGGFGGIELVDAELRAVRVASGIHQQVAEDSIYDPRWNIAMIGNLAERDFQFVHLIVACFIHARGLAGWAHELPAEEIRQRRVIVPIPNEAAQQIGPAKERRILRRCAADDDVIPAARASVSASTMNFSVARRDCRASS
jgi:hypothetical protein